MNKFTKNMLAMLALAIVGYFIGLVLSAVVETGSVTITADAIMSPLALAGLGLGLLGYFMMLLNGKMKFDDKNAGSAKVKEKGDLKKFYDNNWLTNKELETNPKFLYSTYDKLSTKDKVGMPIRAELKNGKMHINMYNKDYHSLIIGTTGSGKTTMYINPEIQILSETNARPSLVISDPKGELYDLHSEKLRKRGYDVLVFDLRQPYSSTRWNPLGRAYDLYQRAHNLRKEVKVHKYDNPRSYKLIMKNGATYGEEWYEFDGIAFPTKDELERKLASTEQILKSAAEEDIQDIAFTLCPIEGKDPIWDQGARSLVNSVMLAMLEDSLNPELGMTKEKFNFYNMTQICNFKDTDMNPIKTLTEYLTLGREETGLVRVKANEVIANADKTAKSYMGIVSNKTSVFGDMGICYATSQNDMNLDTFATKPTALFIKIPDEKENRHTIATIFISQLYKILVAKASETDNKLPRPVYFILDEFANLPKIEKMGQMITVARSRNIFFTLVVQSYSQLTGKYGQELADIIKQNCNIHIYIAAGDQATKEEFSKRCGNITVETESTSISKAKDEKSGSSKSTSLVKEQRPLIYPNELDSLNGELIVSILKESPIKSRFTPSYEAKSIYYMQKPQVDTFNSNYFDYKSNMYNIRERNQKFKKPRTNLFDDGDFI